MTATGKAGCDDLRWPASPWPASAPESYLLLHHQRRPVAREALKLGILELLARRSLHLVEVERSGHFGRRSRQMVLVAGRPGQVSLASHGPVLAALRDVFDGQRQRHEPLWGAGPEGEHVDGLDVADYARALVREYGSVDGFVKQVVRPALIARGWMAAERYRILGMFPATRCVLSREGVAAQGDLLWRVEYGNRQLGRLVDEAPSRAVAFAGLAGAAVLLMDDARPHLLRLKERLAAGAQPQTTGSAAGGSLPPGAGAALDPGLDLDVAGLDVNAVGLDLGGLEAVNSAMDAVAAGVDAGSGGDGGGGSDGGGGGDGGSSS